MRRGHLQRLHLLCPCRGHRAGSRTSVVPGGRCVSPERPTPTPFRSPSVAQSGPSSPWPSSYCSFYSQSGSTRDGSGGCSSLNDDSSLPVIIPSTRNYSDGWAPTTTNRKRGWAPPEVECCTQAESCAGLPGLGRRAILVYVDDPAGSRLPRVQVTVPVRG